MTRNLTLAIDDELLDKVRLLAAMKRTSVNERAHWDVPAMVIVATS